MTSIVESKKKWAINHPEYHKKWRENHPGYWKGYDKKRLANNAKNYRVKIKKEVIGHYGAVCSCCGEVTIDFLTIDHINGGGTKQRRTNGVGGGIHFYIWLKTNAYPKGFQVLCFNCNCGRAVNKGVCPHKEVSSD